MTKSKSKKEKEVVKVEVPQTVEETVELKTAEAVPKDLFIPLSVNEFAMPVVHGCLVKTVTGDSVNVTYVPGVKLSSPHVMQGTFRFLVRN